MIQFQISQNLRCITKIKICWLRSSDTVLLRSSLLLLSWLKYPFGCNIVSRIWWTISSIATKHKQDTNFNRKEIKIKIQTPVVNEKWMFMKEKQTMHVFFNFTFGMKGAFKLMMEYWKKNQIPVLSAPLGIITSANFFVCNDIIKENYYYMFNEKNYSNSLVNKILRKQVSPMSCTASNSVLSHDHVPLYLAPLKYSVKLLQPKNSELIEVYLCVKGV